MKKYSFRHTAKYFLPLQQIFSFVVVVASIFFSVANLNAQNEKAGDILVNGTVYDAATKNPVIGARITIADRSLSVITNEEGSFSIKIPTTSEVFVVSAPDYALREIPVRGRQSIDIELFSDKLSSGYEAVEILSLLEKRSSILTEPFDVATDFGQSVSSTIESDIQQRLGADVRTITRSGVPGIGSTMFIRGLNSLYAKAQPLIIVDGVFFDNQLNSTSIHEGFFSNPLTSIDVKDIESVTVIKDGNSIYGSKGANGVILIKTNRATDMTTQIVATASVGLNQKPSFPKMMNASEYRSYIGNHVDTWMSQNNITEWNDERLLRIFPFLIEDETNRNYNTYHNDTDWVDEVYRHGVEQSYGLSVKGGDEIALYNLSMGYTNNEGTVKETAMERLNARFNADIRMSTKMFTKVDIAITKLSRDLRDEGVNSKTSPGFVGLIKAPILTTHKYLNGKDQLSPKLATYDTLDPTLANAVSNPVSIIEEAMGTSGRTHFNLRVNPYFNFNENLTIGTTFAYTYSKVKESFFMPKEGIAPRIIDGEVREINEVRDLAQRQTSIFSDTRIDWKLELDKNNNLNVLGGFRYTSDDYNSMLPRAYGTANDYIKVIKIEDDHKYKYVSGEQDSWKTMSWYANVMYDYRKKYILSLTASADASSRFGKKANDGVKAFGVKWGVFPSASAAWLISSEDFMKDVNFIDFMKLRASYGLTGNDDVNPYASHSYFRSELLTGGDEKLTGLILGNIANDKIQWETTKKANIGLDFHIFNERLAVTLDFYNSTTDNLLTLKSLKDISGLDYYWTNEGKLKNKGYEMSFNAKVLNLPTFKWELGASIGRYKNEIAALPDNKEYTTDIVGGGWILTEVGRPAGVFYGYKTNGVYKTTQDALDAGLTNANNVPYTGGDVKFVDIHKDGQINEDDRTVIGDPNPDFYGSIFTKFAMKRFTLDVLFTYSYGNDVYNYLRSQLESGSSFYNQTTSVINRWRADGQETSIPRAVYGDPAGNNIFSDRWIEDGSYLRLKTVSLSYDIPLKLTYIRGLSIWASVNNLWTWTNYLGSDPEFSMSNSVLFQGIDSGLTPQGRSYHLGVKINL